MHCHRNSRDARRLCRRGRGRGANLLSRLCAQRVKGSDVTDDMIRFQMTVCRDLCEEESRAKQVASGIGPNLDACELQPVSENEFKALRSASASFLIYAHAFTWDIHNILPHKIIRKVEISYPTLDLDETTATGGGTVLPGETATILINGSLRRLSGDALRAQGQGYLRLSA